MGYFKDLREHIAALDQAGLLVRIDEQINKDTELMPLVRWQFRGLSEEERRAFRSEERRVGKEGRSLCDWSSDVCSSDLGLLVRIDEQINKDTELMPLVRWQFRGLSEEERRAF